MEKQRGFTLIELMVVIAIIGILASTAVPQYQSYTTRAMVSEAIVLAGELKPAIVEFYKSHGRFPVDNAEAGLPAPDKLPGNYVKTMTVDHGAIHVRLGNRLTLLAGKTLTLRPQYVADSPQSPVSWLCGHVKAVDGMTAAGDDRTDVEAVYLPGSCR
jgi:type IV pilus assembly protein PilA